MPNGITRSVWCPELQGVMCGSQERGEKASRAPEEATVLEGTKNMQESGPTKKFPSQGLRRAYRSNVNYKQTENKSDNVKVRRAEPLRCYTYL